MKNIELYNNENEYVVLELLSKEVLLDNDEHNETLFQAKVKSDIYEINITLGFYIYKIVEYLKQLKNIDNNLSGEAKLNNRYYDDDFNVLVSSVGELGEISFKLVVKRNIHGKWFEESDLIIFERIIDQSYLPSMISAINEFIISI